MNEVFAHPVVVGVLVILMTGVILAFVRFHFRTAKTLDRIDEFVLPHFRPPKPGEPDVSLPGQVRGLADETTKVRSDLREHMRLEEEQRSAAATATAKNRSLLRRVARQIGLDPDG